MAICCRLRFSDTTGRPQCGHVHRTEEEGAATLTVQYELAMFRRAFVIQQKLVVLDRIPVFPEFEAGASRDVYIPDGDHRTFNDARNYLVKGGFVEHVGQCYSLAVGGEEQG